MRRFKFLPDKVQINTPEKSLKKVKSQRSYVYRYKSKPAWKNLSIAKRNKKYVLVGVKK